MRTTLEARQIERYRERGFLLNILTDEQVARLQVGSPLDDDSQNPVVWSRTRAPTFA